MNISNEACHAGKQPNPLMQGERAVRLGAILALDQHFFSETTSTAEKTKSLFQVLEAFAVERDSLILPKLGSFLRSAHRSDPSLFSMKSPEGRSLVELSLRVLESDLHSTEIPLSLLQLNADIAGVIRSSDDEVSQKIWKNRFGKRFSEIACNLVKHQLESFRVIEGNKFTGPEIDREVRSRTSIVRSGLLGLGVAGVGGKDVIEVVSNVVCRDLASAVVMIFPEPEDTLKDSLRTLKVLISSGVRVDDKTLQGIETLLSQEKEKIVKIRNEVLTPTTFNPHSDFLLPLWLKRVDGAVRMIDIARNRISMELRSRAQDELAFAM